MKQGLGRGLSRTFSFDAIAFWTRSFKCRKKHTQIRKWNDSEAREPTMSVATVAAKRKPRIPGGCAPAGPGSDSGPRASRQSGIHSI